MKLQLKTLRKEKKITQGELSSLLSVDIKTVGNWERGETMMSIEQLCRCCEILGATPNEMTGWYIEHPEDAPGAAAGTDPYEGELVECYRAATAEGRANILGNARGQRELSLKTSERLGHETDIEEMSA